MIAMSFELHEGASAAERAASELLLDQRHDVALAVLEPRGLAALLTLGDAPFIVMPPISSLS